MNRSVQEVKMNNKEFNFRQKKEIHIKRSYHNDNNENTTQRKTFSELTKEDAKQGRSLPFVCRIEEIKQTGGPTIFTLYDGSRTIKATGFISPGKRAFPNVNVEDVVEVFGKIMERDDMLEIEIKRISTLDDSMKASFDSKMNHLENEKAEPEDVDFLVQSETLQLLKPNILAVAKEIRKAVFSNRPIIVKHHHDCDGYASGIALERAILPLIMEHHHSTTAKKLYFKRTPSKAPFYDYTDAVKDMSMFIDDMNNFGQKAPLIILSDNGSTEEDLLSIIAVKHMGADVVVVDHHSPGELVNGKTKVDEHILAHVNPYLVGSDSTLCAGVLATEIAHFIYKDVTNVNHLPGIAALADRSEGADIEKYKEITKKHGFSEEDMKKITSVVDFQSHFVRFMEARGLMNIILDEDINEHRPFIEHIYAEIEKRHEKAILAAKHYMFKEEVNGHMLVSLDADKLTSRAEYPTIGRVVSLIHGTLENENPNAAIVSMGLGPDFVTFRMTDAAQFDVNKLIAELQEKVPYGNVDGGGHEHAGTLKFLAAAKDDVHRILFARLRGQ